VDREALSEIKHAGYGRAIRRVAQGGAVLAAALACLAWPERPVALDGAGPLPGGTRAVSSHAPYTSNDCALCHLMRKGAPPPETGDALCLSCHEDARAHAHAPRKCTRCHNAHDSTRPKLLRGDLGRCPDCHRFG
jgi:predicted CXXCH cytochrome family protein